jgi:class 3 adenylate cyclase/tetratricopeptide (TPR) repeat protein
VTPGGDQGAVATATVTVMFTDIVGSTVLIDSLGDVAAERARRAHYALLRAALDATNGREVKNTGDGLMAVFASTHDAVRCGISIQQAVARHGRHFRPALQVRVGIHVGEAIADEGDYFGATVNIARRLCDIAEPAQVLASSVVEAVLGRSGDFRFEPLGPLPLKGFAEPVPAAEVTWSLDEVEARALPPALRSRERMPFVGREAELDALEAAWGEVPSGGARVAALVGEAGIGKSRLAKEFALAARDAGAVVLFGRCDEDPLVPFQPFVEALRDVLGDLAGSDLAGLPAGTVANLARLVPELDAQPSGGPGGDGSMDRYLLFEAVGALLARLSEDGPLLFVIEDVHWADRPTLLLLSHLLSGARAGSTLFLVTFRDTEGASGPAQVLADLHRDDRVTRIALGGLAGSDVGALVAAAVPADEAVPVDLASSILQRTEGNPLFVRELVRDAIESGFATVAEPGSDGAGAVPESLRGIILRRIDRLSAVAQEALAAAAVIGGVFDLEVLTRAMDLDAAKLLDAVDEAVAAREITEAPAQRDVFTFSHDLVRRALYGRLPRGRRAELHRRVADAIARVHGDDERWLSSLAHHYGEGVAAGGPDEAVRYGALAGDRALRTFAYEEAIAQYGRALDLLDRSAEDDAERRGALLLGLGRARVYVGEMGAAGDAFRAAAAAGRAAGRPDVVATAAIGLGQRGSSVTTIDAEVVALLEEAAAGLASHEAHGGLRAQVLARLARELFGGGRRADAERLSEEALACARASGDHVGLGVALNARRQCLEGLGNLHNRLAIDEEILTIAEAAGDQELALTSVASLVIDHLRFGDLSEVDRWLGELARRAETVRHTPRVDWYLGTYRAMRAILDGRLDEAERVADETLAVGQRAQIPDAVANHTAQIVAIRLEQGRLHELVDLVAAFATDPDGLLAWPLLHSLALVEAGRTDEAADVLAAIDAERFRALPQDDFWLLTLSLGAEAAGALGDRDRAAVLLDLLRPAAGHQVVVGGGVVSRGSVDRYLGVLEATLGHLELAEQHFAAAVAANDEMGAVVAAVGSRLDWARLLRASGRRTRADILVEEAADIAERAGFTVGA